jgi:hypothetical protein
VGGEAAPPQSFEEGLGGGLTKHRRPSAGGKRDDRAVLRDDRIDDPQVTGHSPEIREDASGHEDHDDPLSAGRRNRGSDARIEHVVIRDRAVVVEREDAKFQQTHLMAVGDRSSERQGTLSAGPSSPADASCP